MRVMYKSVGILVFAVLVIAVAGSATAQPGQIFMFDENGNGVFGGQPIQGVPALDPMGTGFKAVMYKAPFPFVPGDVVLMEPQPAGPDAFSDLVRFWQEPTGGSSIYFMSEIDTEPGGLDMADSIPPGLGLQLPLQTNHVQLVEVGDEGLNGLVYTPLPGGPGEGAGMGPLPITYNIVSDVPEPSALALLGVGAIGLMACGWWQGRRKK